MHWQRPGCGGVNSAVHTSLPCAFMSISKSALAESASFQRSTTRNLSSPAAKQWASTAILSPAIRLAENRPQSTVGRTASMTARTLPSLATAFPAQNEGRQGRQREAHRFDTAVSAHRDGFDCAQVAPSGAAVYLRVGIDDLAPKPARGNADEKILPRHGRKIAHDQQRRPAVSRLAQKRDNAHLGIADIHPLEALRREIHLVQGRFAAIDAIQIADEPLDAGVFRQAGHPPLEFTFVGPFTALPELSAHE